MLVDGTLLYLSRCEDRISFLWMVLGSDDDDWMSMVVETCKSEEKYADLSTADSANEFSLSSG